MDSMATKAAHSFRILCRQVLQQAFIGTDYGLLDCDTQTNDAARLLHQPAMEASCWDERAEDHGFYRPVQCAYASKDGQEPTHRWLELASGTSLTTDLTKSAGMALVLPELAKDVDISPNEVFQNTGVRASVSGLADAVDLATSSVATAESLKQAGYHTIVAQHGNRTSNAVGTMEAVKLTQLAAAAKQGTLLGARGGGGCCPVACSRWCSRWFWS
jgi:hypothetical protein